MKINADLLQIIFTTAAFSLILYLSHIFADEPASRINPGNQPELVETNRDRLPMETVRQPAKKSVRQEQPNMIKASSETIQ